MSTAVKSVQSQTAIRTARRRRISLGHIPLTILAIFSLLPLVLLTVNSIKTNFELKSAPFAPPTALHFENFAHAWDVGKLNLAFGNSLLVSSTTVLGVCLLGGMAAYTLARYGNTLTHLVMTYFLLSLSVPALLYIIPLFAIWRRLNLTDNLLGIIIIYCAIYMPFSVFLLRSYFLGLPPEIEDAARVDGCDELGVFRHVIIPLSWPAFASVAVIVGIWSWNEFLFAITFLHTPEVSTVAVRYTAFTGQYSTDYASISAAGVMMMAPAMILFLLLQRRFIEGMVAGGLKA
jgi:raffinose/stachyose/melibiose transport system permease protein